MDIKNLRPQVFSADPENVDCRKEWLHWQKMFTTYTANMTEVSDTEKLNLLINHVDASVYELISEVTTYKDAIKVLESTYVKRTNPIFARYELISCQQQSGESLDRYLRKLKQLSMDCDYQAVSAQLHKEEAIRDAFIGGIISNEIRQRLLEDSNLTLQVAFEKARSLETAQRNAESYQFVSPSAEHIAKMQSCAEDKKLEDLDRSHLEDYSAATAEKCIFCGNSRHPHKFCPANNRICFKCSKRGHFSKMCRSKLVKKNETTTTASLMGLSTISHSKVNIEVLINGLEANALLDTGSSLSHLSYAFCKKLKLDLDKSRCSVGLAINGYTSKGVGKCVANVKLNKQNYDQVSFIVLKGLLTDVILGQDFMDKHQNVNIHLGGPLPTLHLGALDAVKTSTPVRLFQHLKSECRPIASKSRRYSRSDSVFISYEVKRLFKKGLIEPSNSPWRAQPLVVTQENHKRRMVINYSQTVNKYTLLDAYPLPRMRDVVQNVARYKVYSTLDLTSAYHQVELPPQDRLYTVFEADGALCQWKRIPFGLTNAVPCFQRIIDDIIKSNNCKGTFAYLDNITVGGTSQQEHDVNLDRFLAVAKNHNLTFNESKCIYNTDTIDLLGYRIKNGTLQPDPARVKTLQDLPSPNNRKEQQRVIGLFAYYAQWIPQYSDKIKPLISNVIFPLADEALLSFQNLKSDLINVSLEVIDENSLFAVETDASDVAVSATLNQNGKPVVFYSRSLSTVNVSKRIQVLKKKQQQ